MSTPTLQQAAALAARGNVLVAAGAGTGKTSTVTERCLQLVLREKCSIEEILMVTFTEAAATEMRERIRHKLRESADQAVPDSDAAHWLAEQLALLDHAPISTLHSFCLDLVRRHFYTVGLDPACVVLDEAQTKPLIHAVLNELLLREYADETAPAAAVRNLIRTYGRGQDDTIRSLVVRIHQYTQTLAAPAEWFATQTALFSCESPDAWREMLLQAVREWRQEWRETIEPYAQGSKTVRACALALDRIPTHSGLENIALQLDAIRIAHDSKWDGLKKDFRDPIKGFFEGASFLLDFARQNGAALTEDWKWVREPMLALLRLAQEFSAAFARAKRELGGIDFTDQEQFALKLLFQTNGRPSAVALSYRQKFRHVFVDECQDINAAQDAILRAVSREGATANRFLVGDVKQSIYRFRLADPRIFQRYQTSWTATVDDGALQPLPGAAGGTRPTSSGQTLALTDNFRSAEGLLRFINPVFQALMRPVIGGLTYDAEAELHFGAPELRGDLSARRDSAPRVQLHILTKDDESGGHPEESEERRPATRDAPDLQTAEREARLIAQRLRALRASGLKVWDRTANPGGFRPVEYADMVVLLRGMAGRAEIFARAFHQFGVPLRAGRAGFLTALEVSDVINLLRLLDNPLQDLPLLAVLRSPFVGLSAEDLAQIRIAQRGGLLWLALQTLAGRGYRLTGELPARLAAFLDQFHRWRELLRHSSLTQCLETALNETHYEALLLAYERGPERAGNVRRLIEMARRFDPFQREGLYRFLQFISEQEEAEVSHQPAEVASGNAVRLMTIHASKGLEFPVVVVAGLGGRFNLRDLSGDILLHEDTGLAPKIFPPGMRSKYPSLAHWYAAQRERRAALGEELRLLYVAMTRARDTLLLVGTASRTGELDRWQQPAAITDHTLLKANGYLEWLRLWFANATRSTDWTDPKHGANDLFSWQFHTAGVGDVVNANPPADEISPLVAGPTKAQLTELRESISFRYPCQDAVAEPAKTTVTTIRRRLADETDDEARRFFPPPYPGLKPAPAGENSPRLSAAEVGIAHHTFMQFVALDHTATELDLRNEAERMRAAGGLTEEQFAALDVGALTGFWQSDVGSALRKVPRRTINREMPFTARIGLDELTTLGDCGLGSAMAGEDFIVVQGQVDLAVLLPEEIWLLDFKTDQIGEAELPAKVKLYEPQLRIYALALARIYHKPVTRCWLHFLSARKTIPIQASACI